MPKDIQSKPQSRPLIATLAIVLVVAAVGAAWLALRRPPTPAAPPPAPVAAAPVAAAPPAPTPPAATAPGFDIVRVNPAGAAVTAGRAEPGSRVVLTLDGHEIGRAIADGSGQWAIVPTLPLPAGTHELGLSSQGADGVARNAAAPVVVALAPPAPANAPQPAAPSVPLALAMPAAGPARVLQGPVTPSGKLGLDAVDYDEAGHIRFAGGAAPNAPVRLYVDDTPIGEARADAAGRWVLQPETAVATGTHRLRLDQLGTDGRVTARVALPFERATVASQEFAGGRVVVQPRQSLWRIARQAYGQGVRYTVIYQANHDQIRDPDLIFPGQVFTLPAPAAPDSAIRSK
jgi:nucleoid-associated protein YgaU